MICGSAAGSVGAAGAYRYGYPLHHITIRPGNRKSYRYNRLPVPLPPNRGLARRITSATESGESPRIGPDAAHAIGFHPLNLLLGEQRIGHESVTVEDGVVEPRHRRIVA